MVRVSDIANVDVDVANSDYEDRRALDLALVFLAKIPYGVEDDVTNSNSHCVRPATGPTTKQGVEGKRLTFFNTFSSLAYARTIISSAKQQHASSSVTIIDMSNI
jgi:hypothetical protein